MKSSFIPYPLERAEENTLFLTDAIILASAGKENDGEISRMVRARGNEKARTRRKREREWVLENEKGGVEEEGVGGRRKSDRRFGRKQERRGASVRDGGARSKVWQKSQMSLDLLVRQLPETSGIPKMVVPARAMGAF